MKKTYNSPIINVVKIRPMNLLTGSAYGTDVRGSASTEYETLSRRGGFSRWEDDDCCEE